LHEDGSRPSSDQKSRATATRSPSAHHPGSQQEPLPFDEWTGIFGAERLTGALLDRLTHHVHILEMNGDSYRLKASRRQKRVTAEVQSN
jgi:hypothetical protein